MSYEALSNNRYESFAPSCNRFRRGGRHIRNSKRLDAYTIDDYDIVVKIMGQYRKVFVTHYILTEISNLIDLEGEARITALEISRTLFNEFGQVNSNMKIDINNNFFIDYGITDCSIIKLAKNHMILTNDNRLLDPLYLTCPDNIIPFEVARSIYGLK